MTYILSQVFICLCYAFMGLSYVVKNRTWILYLNFVALILNGTHYTLLGAWAGVGVIAIAIVRNILFLLQQKIEKLNKSSVFNWSILIFLIIVSVFVAIFTYDTALSLFSTFASMTYTISIWQKNIKIYKILGFVSSALNLIYYIYIGSLFGVILELLVEIITIIFTILYIKNEKKTKEVRKNVQMTENEVIGI